jgi:DNA polymerase V
VKTVLALIDCRNFYVSVERVFNSTTRAKPVLVLSNNDGCVVALSEEAKQLGIRRGMPLFECQELVDTHQVALFSSNYALYQDFSDRVMQTLSAFAPKQEIYSIDEAWLDLTHVQPAQLPAYGRTMLTTVQQHTGLPVHVAIATTKTLSKIAHEILKQQPEYQGVLSIVTLPQEDIDTFLAQISVDDVWGIGTHFALALNAMGIYTARQLKDADMFLLKRRLNVTVQRTVLELRGVSCLPLEPHPKRKQHIASAKTFSRPVETLDDLSQAIATYTARAAEKLRSERSVAGSISVFITTNRFNKKVSQYANSASRTIHLPTAFTPVLMHAALDALRNIYREGYEYKKAGVFLSNIRPQEHIQFDLFGAFSLAQHQTQNRLMHAIDVINRLWGQDTIFFGAQGLVRTWQMRQERRSPRYTTRWQELLEVSM